MRRAFHRHALIAVPVHDEEQLLARPGIAVNLP